MRQTKHAMLMLLSAYRAVYRRAILAALAGAVALVSAGESMAVTRTTLVNTASDWAALAGGEDVNVSMTENIAVTDADKSLNSLLIQNGGNSMFTANSTDITVSGNTQISQGSTTQVLLTGGSTLKSGGETIVTAGSSLWLGNGSAVTSTGDVAIRGSGSYDGTSRSKDGVTYLRLLDQASSVSGTISATINGNVHNSFGALYVRAAHDNGQDSSFTNNANLSLTINGNLTQHAGETTVGSSSSSYSASLKVTGDTKITGGYFYTGLENHLTSDHSNVGAATVDIGGNLTLQSNYSGKTKLKVAGKGTLNVGGDLVSEDDGVGISIFPLAADQTATVNVKGKLDICAGFIDIGAGPKEIDEESLTPGYGVVNVGGDLYIVDTAAASVYEKGTLNVTGNATIDASPSSTADDEDKAAAAKYYPGYTLNTLVAGKMTVGGSLTVGGEGLTIYGKNASVTVGGAVNTSAASSIYLFNGATFTGTKAAMLNSDATAKNDSIAKGTFNVDATSTVAITGVSTITTATAQAIRGELFATDSGIISFVGATYTDAPTSSGVSFTDALKYAGTDALASKTITGINAPITSGSHSWGSATLAAGTSVLSIQGGGLALSNASDSGNFVSNSDGSVASVDLASGTELALNGSGAVADITGSGDLKVGTGTGGAVKANKVEVASLTMANGSSLTAASSVSMGEGTLDGGSSISAGTITLTGTGKTLSILGGSHISANNLSLNGNTIFADPDWTEAASVIYLNSLTNDTLDGDIVVGQNSGFYLGSSLTETDFANYLAANLSASGTTAIGYVVKAFTVGDGSSLTVDGSLTSDTATKADNSLVVAANSALVITGNALSSGAAITFATAGTVTNDGTVQLKDVDVSNGASYAVFKTVSTLSGSGTYTMANALYTATATMGDDGTITINASYDEDQANTVLAKTDEDSATAVKAQASSGGTFTAASFLNQALSLASLASNASRASAIGQALNSAARFAVLAGGIQNAQMASAASTRAVEERMGLGTGTVSRVAPLDGTHASIWLQPLYGHQRTSKLDAYQGGKHGVSTDLYGAALGSDVTMGNFLVGGAFSIGKGDSKSRGDLAYTKNDFNFYGLSLYGRYDVAGFRLMGDLGYTWVRGDAKQSNAVGQLKGDVDTGVFTVGLNGMYTFSTSYLDIAPHVGVRYSHYNVKGNTVKYGSESLRAKSFSAKVVTFPVGVTLSKTFRPEGWLLRPALDLELIPAAGDTHVRSKLVATSAELSGKSDVIDSLSYSASAGLDAEMGNFGLGLGYGFTGSRHAKDHSVYLNARYTF